MSFSSLSHCLIIALTGLHAWGHETVRHRHWQVCTHRHTLLAGADCTKGCQSFLLCCFSLTCLVQSKTVSKSDRRRKKGKEERERDRLFLVTVMTLFMQLHLKLNFLFLSDNMVSGLLLLLKCPQAFCTHRCSHTHTYRWEKHECSRRRTFYTVSSSYSVSPGAHTCVFPPKKGKKRQVSLLKSDIFANAIRTFSEMPQLNGITTEYIYLSA